MVNLEDIKKKAYLHLTDTLISSLEKNEITESDMQKSAQFITFHLDRVESSIELMVFLEKLIEKWPIYKNVHLIFKAEEHKEEDQKKLAEIQGKLNQFINK